MNGKRISRRLFLAGTAAAVAGCKTRAPGIITSRSPNEKLNIAGIGAGGKGRADIGGCSKENIVALCDVDMNMAADSINRYPNAKVYKDFREMLEKQKDIDAVTVSTPDHTHAVAAMAAMQLGKHVYVQKPLTHNIYEARMLQEAAHEYRVATQMGNQGHSNSGVRDVCEWMWSGAIGDVREVHIWTNRPVWPQNLTRPAKTDPVREGLDWDLWLGPAPERPYVDIHPDTNRQCYCPFVWRGWWDFGCGALGDMACHIMDPANWALFLGVPISVEPVSWEGGNNETAPTKSVIKYEFPARKAEGKKFPACTVYWYDGGNLPPRPADIPADVELGGGDNGTLFVGEKGYMTCGTYGEKPRLLPEEMHRDFKRPDRYIPRVGGPYKDWINACKTGEPACSNFDYSVPFTEMVLLGNLALRTKQKILWDAANMKVTNVPEANLLVKREYRAGWSL
ncbi:MAG: Gfo/Idh/MocA family oxidoreductase [bacterium]|nr:Gfo/Idh/MocA family oxidoreductase [bacterium]